MKRVCACMALVMAVLSAHCVDVNISTDDDEFEEVVIRRRKTKRPADAQANVAAPSAPTVAAVAVAAEPPPPPPPPEPPEAEAAEPRRLIRYFCKAWKDQDWTRMWWAMSPQYRRKVSLKKFTKLFTEDAEANGGLKDENIVDEGETNAGVGVKVELVFKFRNARRRVVKAEVQRISGGQYRVVESPFIPMDLNDL